MLDEAAKLKYVKAFLRRTKSLEELKQMSVDVFTQATETVTLTANSFEGGSGSGSVTFEKAIIGLALEELIAEKDPNYVHGPDPVAHCDFSRRPLTA